MKLQNKRMMDKEKKTIDWEKIDLTPHNEKKIKRSFTIDKDVLLEIRKFEKNNKQKINLSFMINEYLWSFLKYLKLKKQKEGNNKSNT